MRPRLYLLPGTMCTARLWSAVSAMLEPGIETVYLPIPMAADVDATVAALAAQLSPGSLGVAGFSLGAYLAARLAVGHPELVPRLMLVSNTPCALSPAEASQRAGILKWVAQHGYKGISRAKAASLAGDGDAAAPIVEAILAMDAELGEPVFRHQMGVLSDRADLAGSLAALDKPIDLVFSRDDPLLDAAWLADFLPACPGARAHPVDGRGHMLPLSHPAALAAILRQWLGASQGQ